ncbi:MAG: hypothetical protein H7Y11_12445, partial [Armatimonadetes bacterium]|nr:hypothetical protein [Anaerolineae bacterium]
NTSFESKIVGSLDPDLTPWVVKFDLNDKIKCTKAGKPVFARTGDCAFRFKGGTDGSNSLKQQPDISLITFNIGDTLDWRIYYTATNTAVDAKLKLRVKYGDGAETGKLNFTLLPTIEGAGYAEYVESYTLISTAVVKIKVQAQDASPSGKLYLDDASLRLNQIARRGLAGQQSGTTDGLIPLPQP